MTIQFQCISTHGGAGYAPGTYVNDKGQVICGACLQVIGNVEPGSNEVRAEGCTGSVKLPSWIGRFGRLRPTKN